MNKFIVLTVLTLTACTTAEQTTACKVDAVAVPLAEVVATAATVTNPGAAVANQAAQIADAPVHTAIQADCAKLPN